MSLLSWRPIFTTALVIWNTCWGAFGKRMVSLAGGIVGATGAGAGGITGLLGTLAPTGKVPPSGMEAWLGEAEGILAGLLCDCAKRCACNAATWSALNCCVAMPPV